ncbi:hypothetical protein [Vibrio agarivorans]|uniref:hypothetical protein n=1 Tax=Vibrio agarivorans TaxID=153622 RepID=UPI0022309656|nr:hypothetical protein [Vibrio agarivorans]
MHAKTTMKALLTKGFSFFVFLALPAIIIHIDVRLLGSQVGENSWVEYTQELSLLAIIIIFAYLYQLDRHYRSFAVLLGGFFTCLLIRELDGVFDQIVHGFWKYPAWAVASISCFYAFGLHRVRTLNQLSAFMAHPSFGLMLAAMGVLMVFSRLFGMGELWQAFLQDEYARGVKNLAEEGVELLDYSIALYSVAWYGRTLSVKVRKTPRVVAG